MDLLVVMGVLLVLVGLLMPAVQSVRESARRTDCSNRLRSMGLAVHGYEGAYRHVPGPWFNTRVDRPGYSSDRGLLYFLLPYLEQQSLADRIGGSPFLVVPANQDSIERSPELFLCPSAWHVARLNDVASFWSGPNVPGLSISTCDYAGNGGFRDEQVAQSTTDWRGFFPVRMGDVMQSHSLDQIRDGTSNTIMFWDSAGGALRYEGSLGDRDVDRSSGNGFTLVIDPSTNQVFGSTGAGGNKTYLRSWLGLRIGGLIAFSEHGVPGSPSMDSRFDRIINVTNQYGGPFSLHPGGANFAMADGSVRFQIESTSAGILFALASRDRGDQSQ